MALNKQAGNMYGFVTHTWNVIKGKCPHDCSYCYMKRFPQNDLRFDEKELKTDLGEGNFIFVGSSCDMWCKEALFYFKIEKILEHCLKYPKNTYLFQTKNPQGFIKHFELLKKLRPNVILGATIETNRQELLSNKAPAINERSDSMTLKGFRKMITIEPIMDFDVMPLESEIRRTNPEFVNIGADSGNNKLQEPSEFKVGNLIKELEKFTKVNLKDNLKRIYSQNITNG